MVKSHRGDLTGYTGAARIEHGKGAAHCSVLIITEIPSATNKQYVMEML
jgi:hypothetical protein